MSSIVRCLFRQENEKGTCISYFTFTVSLIAWSDRSDFKSWKPTCHRGRAGGDTDTPQNDPNSSNYLVPQNFPLGGKFQSCKLAFNQAVIQAQK